MKYIHITCFIIYNEYRGNNAVMNLSLFSECVNLITLSESRLIPQITSPQNLMLSM